MSVLNKYTLNGWSRRNKELVKSLERNSGDIDKDAQKDEPERATRINQNQTAVKWLQDKINEALNEICDYYDAERIVKKNLH